MEVRNSTYLYLLEIFFLFSCNQASSIERPECPSKEEYKLVRADIMASGYLFRTIPNSPDYMEVSERTYYPY